MQSPPKSFRLASPTRTNKLVRVAVRYGRGSPAHISATRQADFAMLATICGARNSYRSGCANVGKPDGLAQQDTIVGVLVGSNLG
jgi:hypothetical protein